MPQDVGFFSKFGFTNTILIIYGAAQLIGGIMLAISKVRIIGAIIVALTFLVSAIILMMAGNIPLAIVTLVTIVLLGMIIKESLKQTKLKHN